MATLSPRKSTVPAPPPQVAEPAKDQAKRGRYTTAELMEIAVQDPKRAQEILDFQRNLKKEAQEEDNDRALTRMKLNNLREVEREALARAQAQAECARAGHIYPTGETRLRGQKVGQGQNRILQLTCNWCYQQYQGIGNEPDQLSPSMASRLDLESYGG